MRFRCHPCLCNCSCNFRSRFACLTEALPPGALSAVTHCITPPFHQIDLCVQQHLMFWARAEQRKQLDSQPFDLSIRDSQTRWQDKVPILCNLIRDAIADWKAESFQLLEGPTGPIPVNACKYLPIVKVESFRASNVNSWPLSIFHHPKSWIGTSTIVCIGLFCRIARVTAAAAKESDLLRSTVADMCLL